MLKPLILTLLPYTIFAQSFSASKFIKTSGKDSVFLEPVTVLVEGDILEIHSRTIKATRRILRRKGQELYLSCGARAIWDGVSLFYIARKETYYFHKDWTHEKRH